MIDSTDLDGSDYGTNNDNDLTLLASTNQTEMSEVIRMSNVLYIDYNIDQLGLEPDLPYSRYFGEGSGCVCR